MKTFVHRGDVLTVAAPSGGVVSGAPVKIGYLFGVPVTSAAEGEDFALQLTGVHDLPRTTGASTSWSVGDRIYWDDTTKKITKTATDNFLIGVAVTAAANADDLGRVRLNPQH